MPSRVSVNNALEVIRKAERGEKIEYATLRNRKQTSDMQDHLPKHYFVADELRKRPDKDKNHCPCHKSRIKVG